LSNRKYNIDSDTLEGHLRIKIYHKITKFIKKLKCEDCGSKENLEMHHAVKYTFTDILCDALDTLKLPYKKYWKEYSKDEIKSIEIMVVGLHFYTRFIVLCDSCHNKEHQRSGKNKATVNRKILPIKYNPQIKYFKSIYPKSSVSDFYYEFNKFYLQELSVRYQNLFLFKDTKESFRKDISDNLITEHLRYFSKEKNNSKIDIGSCGMSVINKILKLYDVPYHIVSKLIRSGEYKCKTYWVLESLKDSFIESKESIKVDLLS